MKKGFKNELLTEQTRLSTIISASDFGTFEWDITTDNIRINQQYASNLGYQLEDLLPYSFQKVQALCHPQFRESLKNKIQDLFDKKTNFFSLVVKYLTKNGQYKWIRTQGRVISWSDDGKPLVMYGSHIDLSETKENEERLRLLEQALYQSPTITLITDTNGVITYVNPMFTQVTGYEYDEVIGKKPNVLKSGFHQDAYYKKIWKTILNGNIWKGEFYNRK